MVFSDRGASAAQVTLFSLKEMLLVIPPILHPAGAAGRLGAPGNHDPLHGGRFGPEGGAPGDLPRFRGGRSAVRSVSRSGGVHEERGKLSNVFIFLGAWSTTKVPMFLFELPALGARFALTRLAVDIPGITLIAVVLVSVLRPEETRQLSERMQRME